MLNNFKMFFISICLYLIGVFSLEFELKNNLLLNSEFETY
jgi:hypothetical protein